MSISMKNKGIKFYVTFWIICINSWFSASFNIRDKYCTQDSNQSKGKDMRIRKENAKNMTKRKLILLFGKRKNTESKRIHVHIANRKFCLSNICVKLFSEVKLLSRVRLFVTLWTVAHQAPLSMGFSRQEYWSGLPFPSPGDLPNPGIEPRCPAWQADAFSSEPPGKPREAVYVGKIKESFGYAGSILC